jgi:hypothetical protein
MTEVAKATLEARVARLQTALHTSPQGRKTMMELFPLGLVPFDPNVGEAEQNWSEWLARLGSVGASLGWDQGWTQSWSQW